MLERYCASNRMPDAPLINVHNQNVLYTHALQVLRQSSTSTFCIDSRSSSYVSPLTSIPLINVCLHVVKIGTSVTTDIDGYEQ